MISPRPLALLLALLLCTAAPSAVAQSAQPEFEAYQSALERGARQANVWQASWTGIYAGSLALNAYQASESDSRDTRYDARVGVVKSALALGGMFLDRQPHPGARRELRDGEGDIEGARRLMQAVAEEERQRRSLEARLGSLAVNTAAGLLIGVGDGRGRDGAINFATGMLVSELQLQTQPRQATAAINRFQPARLSLGELHLEGEYALLVAPNQLGVTLRY
ncbi:hypothetical protein HOP52_13885 [Halomonas campisalis]|uniref:Uncharacterized protein n=1 Tax=Billgrantia campisalis TaxID=74661 RepID=A0ABS9PAR8_9GAMM|nr:hypothetical protein [Halomonas campisalis]MCG6658846.1 hypothetical protein [Halomonas campisalis]MDR5864505.1 hypothetical protein [Halomonas campisalis]